MKEKKPLGFVASTVMNKLKHSKIYYILDFKWDNLRISGSLTFICLPPPPNTLRTLKILLFGIWIGPALWCLKLLFWMGLKPFSGKRLNPSLSVFGICRWFLPSEIMKNQTIWDFHDKTFVIRGFFRGFFVGGFFWILL